MTVAGCSPRDRSTGPGRCRGTALLAMLMLVACGAPQPPAASSATRGAAQAPPSADADAAADRPGTAAPASGSSGEPAHAPAPPALQALEGALAAIDEDMPGEFGAWIRHLPSGHAVAHDADRPWYLSSTVKVPVAIAVLQLVEEGVLELEHELVLARSDFVDGAGDIIWQEPGARYSVGTLLEKSLVNSDSTATDMLIRLIGADELNRRVAEWVPEGFGELTTILEVRYLAYGELHPGVAELSNMDLVRLKNADPGQPRLRALLDALGVDEQALALRSIDEAFERYYATGMNSATLEAFGTLLERLVAGELLDEEHTALLLGHMQRITTGDRRIASGLPDGVAFAQKTGTQLARACNMGILHPDAPERAVVVASCAERYDALPQAERAFAELGRALAPLAH